MKDLPASLLESYRALSQTSVVFELGNWNAIRVTGKDALDYLQRMGTADLRKLEPGRAIQSLFLQGDGRLVADSIVLSVTKSEFILFCPVACGAGLLAQLDRFIFTEEVTLEDLTENLNIFMVSGQSQEKFLVEAERGLGGNLAYAFAVTLAPSATRSFLVTSRDAQEAVTAGLQEVLARTGSFSGSPELYDVHRIESGCPLFGRELTEKTIPLEAGLKPAISFTKGCFPGQEVVARINNLGHPANVLVGLVLPDSAESLVGCSLVCDGKQVGRITSICFSPALNAPLGLGYTKWAKQEPGQQLSIEGCTGGMATIVTLPIGPN